MNFFGLGIAKAALLAVWVALAGAVFAQPEGPPVGQPQPPRPSRARATVWRRDWALSRRRRIRRCCRESHKIVAENVWKVIKPALEAKP